MRRPRPIVREPAVLFIRHLHNPGVQVPYDMQEQLGLCERMLRVDGRRNPPSLRGSRYCGTGVPVVSAQLLLRYRLHPVDEPMPRSLCLQFRLC